MAHVLTKLQTVVPTSLDQVGEKVLTQASPPLGPQDSHGPLCRYATGGLGRAVRKGCVALAVAAGVVGKATQLSLCPWPSSLTPLPHESLGLWGI